MATQPACWAPGGADRVRNQANPSSRGTQSTAVQPPLPAPHNTAQPTPAPKSHTCGTPRDTLAAPLRSVRSCPHNLGRAGGTVTDAAAAACCAARHPALQRQLPPSCCSCRRTSCRNCLVPHSKVRCGPAAASVLACSPPLGPVGRQAAGTRSGWLASRRRPPTRSLPHLQLGTIQTSAALHRPPKHAVPAHRHCQAKHRHALTLKHANRSGTGQTRR